jgi:hypothetical protein
MGKFDWKKSAGPWQQVSKAVGFCRATTTFRGQTLSSFLSVLGSYSFIFLLLAIDDNNEDEKKR